MTPFERRDVPWLIGVAIAVVVIMLIAVGIWGGK